MGLRFPTPTPAVKRLLIANFAIFLAVFLAGLGSPAVEGGVVRWLGLSPALWVEGFPFVPVWQLVTYGFLHAGLGHVFWNMVQLYFFGTMVEEAVGSRRFVSFYLVAIALGGLAQLLAGIVGGSLIPAVGASGGVLAAVVAAAVMQPRAMVILLFIPIQLKWLAIGIVGIDVFSMLSSWKAGVMDGVAHWAHIGGAAWGFLAVRRRWIWIDPLERLRERRVAAEAEQKRSDEQRMDELLAKISREGMGSLTRREREFLKRVSSRR
jgi:membrane associated rhomboid family serine protease